MHSFPKSFCRCRPWRALFYHVQNWSESEERDRDGDRNFPRSRFPPFARGFMSFTVANDFAFPNEGIRWGSIRRMTFDLAKTGFRRIRKDIRTERCRARRKNIDDRFRSSRLTQISPRAFRIVDVAAANVRLQLRPIFFEFSLNRPLVFACWFGYR